MNCESSHQISLKQRIATRDARVAVVGLGYVGLPLALTAYDAGFDTTGVDLNSERVNRIMQGEQVISYLAPDRISSAVESGRLRATQDSAALADADIGVDMIVQTQSRTPGQINLEFSVAYRDLEKARIALETACPEAELTYETGLAKVSVVGAGLRQRADVARSLFGVLGSSGITVKVLATSEIKISALIDNEAVERAVRALHAAYGLDRN